MKVSKCMHTVAVGDNQRRLSCTDMLYFFCYVICDFLKTS